MVTDWLFQVMHNEPRSKLDWVSFALRTKMVSQNSPCLIAPDWLVKIGEMGMKSKRFFHLSPKVIGGYLLKMAQIFKSNKKILLREIVLKIWH